MTNEPEFPESDGLHDSPSTSDPDFGSAADSDPQQAGSTAGEPERPLTGDTPHDPIEATTEFDDQASDVPKVDDLFGPEDDVVDYSVSDGDGAADSVDNDLYGSAEVGTQPEGVDADEFDSDTYADTYLGPNGDEETPGQATAADTAAEEAFAEEAGYGAQASAEIPPPIAGPVPAARQLTRDPYTSFGGVASGLAQHFGIDVSIVRIAFVLLTVTSGIGIVLYLLGWLVIPRAKFWPPVPRAQASNGVSGRELGFLLAGLGILIFWFAAGGSGAQFFVPLLLIAGGIWFLSQPDRRVMAEPAAASAAAVPMAPVPGPQTTARSVMTDQQASSPPPQVYSAPYYGAPVEPRSRARRIFRPLAIISVFVLPVLLLGGLIVGALAFVIAEREGEFDVVSVSSEGVESVGSVDTPASFDDIPQQIEGDGEIELDLTEIDPATFDGEPVPVSIDAGFGSIRVIVPEGMDIDVDAEVTAGEISVFDKQVDGLGSSLTYGKNDPMVELDISLNAGEVIVEDE